MLSTTSFRPGLKIEIDNTPYEIVEFLHVKPGKGGAFVRTKLRNLLNGRVTDQTFRAGEKFAKPDLASTTMQYLYKDGSDYVFMDMESYEQVHVAEERLGDQWGYLKEGKEVQVLLYRGEMLDLDLPAAVALQIVETEPGIQGDRVSNATKPAKVETGLVVKVPLFINEGDTVKIDTRTGEYISRE